MLCFPPAHQVRDFLKKLTIHRCIKTCARREEIPGPGWPAETWDSLPLLLSKRSMKECLEEIEMCSLKLGGIRLLPMLLKGMWGPAARRSKANKQARLVEREVCFISDAGHWGRGEDGRHLSKGLSHPCWEAGSESIIASRGGGGWWRGLHAETAY